MKTNILKSVTVVASVAAMMTSCSLDKEPYGVLTADQLTDDDANGLLISAYQGVEAHFLGNNEAFSGPITNWIFDVRSDDAVKGGDAISMEENIHQLEMSNLTSTNASNLFKWKNAMYAIPAVNDAIRAVASNPSYKMELAELRFLHAFYYFDLLKLFQYLPYIDENSIVRETPNTQYSQAEIYDMEIQKLEAAYKDMSEDYPVVNGKVAYGRATKYAAAALLAKMYAQRPGQTNWAKVEAWADSVISSHKYKLYDNFADMSKIEFNNSWESIFALQVTTADDNMHINYCNLLNTTRSGAHAIYGDNADDFFLASQDLVNAFRTDADGLPLLDGIQDGISVATDGSFMGNVDPRLDLTVGRVGIPWKSPDASTYVYDDSWCRNKAIYGEYSGKKFLERPGVAKAGYPWGCSALNFILLRYSDIVLLAAEAKIELNRCEDGRTLINDVRRKAIRSLQQYQNGTYQPIDMDDFTANYKVSEYPSAGWTQDYARKAVRMERRLELAMEGQRWFDLIRWGVATEVMNKYYAFEKKYHTYLDGAEMNDQEYYLPIPLDEITKSNGLYQAVGKAN